MGEAVEFAVPKEETQAIRKIEPEYQQIERVLALIERVASDPQASIEKLEKMIELQERIMAHNARAAYDTAFAEMQPELPEIEENGRVSFKDKNGNQRATPYALFEDINKAVKPILAKHGFSLSHRREDAQGAIRVTTILAHRSGHREQTSFSGPVDDTGSKNAVQAIKSTMSYAERINVTLLLNISTRGADDDGQAAGVISEEQVKEIEKLWEPLTAEQRTKFLEWMGVKSVTQINPKDFQKAINGLHAKTQAKPEKKEENALYAEHFDESGTYRITGSAEMLKAYSSALKHLWNPDVKAYVATPEQYGKLISRLEVLKVKLIWKGPVA